MTKWRRINALHESTIAEVETIINNLASLPVNVAMDDPTWMSALLRARKRVAGQGRGTAYNHRLLTRIDGLIGAVGRANGRY